jgi:nitrogen fixation protein NifU and related proteins
MNNAAVDSDLRDLYQDLILDHSKHPHNFRALPDANREALGHNPLCGDRLSLHLKVDADDVIQDVGFQGSGCAISVASASMMTDMLKGRNLAEAKELFDFMHAACTGENTPHIHIAEDDRERLQALAGVRHYPMRVKCATLAWHTMQAALKDEKKVSTE